MSFLCCSLISQSVEMQHTVACHLSLEDIFQPVVRSAQKTKFKLRSTPLWLRANGKAMGPWERTRSSTTPPPWQTQRELLVGERRSAAAAFAPRWMIKGPCCYVLHVRESGMGKYRCIFLVPTENAADEFTNLWQCVMMKALIVLTMSHRRRIVASCIPWHNFYQKKKN